MSVLRYVTSPSRRVLLTGVARGCLLSVLCQQGETGQIDARIYFQLRRGMLESEVLVRAGPPDLVTSPGTKIENRFSGGAREIDPGVYGADAREHEIVSVIKQLHYIPGPQEHDPYLTVITIRQGIVADIQRTKMLTRPRYFQNPSESGQRRNLPEAEIQIRKAQETLETATKYAEIRARFKGSGAIPPAPGEESVYQTRQPDGIPLYSDRPPPFEERQEPLENPPPP